jgi:hypothetical protein
MTRTSPTPPRPERDPGRPTEAEATARQRKTVGLFALLLAVAITIAVLAGA